MYIYSRYNNLATARYDDEFYYEAYEQQASRMGRFWGFSYAFNSSLEEFHQQPAMQIRLFETGYPFNMRQVYASAPNMHVFKLNLVHLVLSVEKAFSNSLIIHEENTEKIKCFKCLKIR